MKKFGFAILAALLLCSCGDLVNNNPTTDVSVNVGKAMLKGKQINGVVYVPKDEFVKLLFQQMLESYS